MNPKLPSHIHNFRLGVWTPEPGDGRSLSRLFGPFNEMRRTDGRLELVRPERTRDQSGWDMDWHYFASLDAMYFLDPFTERDLSMIVLARATGCRVWVDYIDDLLNVPPSNPQFHAFMQRDQVRSVIEEIIGLADVVTTTTFTLKCRLPKRERIAVLPEACRWPQCPLPRQRVVTWRGLGSHREDLESVLPQIAEIAQMPQFSKWQWAFIGEPSFKVYDAIPRQNLTLVPFQSPYDFMNTWGGLAPYLHIAPIIDTPFNRAKTPLVWLEASAIGAGVIGPSLPEWNPCVGLMQYRTPEEFGEILKRELFTFVEKEPDQPTSNFHLKAIESRADIYPSKTSAALNELRWHILNKLAGGNGHRDTERTAPEKKAEVSA